MTRQYWRPSNLLNPVPAVMISCADENGKANVMTEHYSPTTLQFNLFPTQHTGT